MSRMPKPLIGISTNYLTDKDSPSKRYSLPAAYALAIEKAGGIPILIPVGIPIPTLKTLFHSIDGLVLSGGGDINPALYTADPNAKTRKVLKEQDSAELALSRFAFDEEKPVLGICRGMQVMNIARGGTLTQDISSEIANAHRHTRDLNSSSESMHPIRLQHGSRLHKIIGKEHLIVNSSHHQTVKHIGQDLIATAWSSDGIIEALELPEHPFALGVQWHPERLLDREDMLSIFSALTSAASR